MPGPALIAAPVLAYASIGATVATTALSVFSSIRGAQAQNAQNAYQANVLKANALSAQYAANDAEARGKIAAQNKNEETALLIGRQRAALAANGVQVDTGSALDITSDTAGIGALDALTIKNNADREAWSDENQARQDRSQAEYTTDQDSSGLGAAGGALLGGIGSIASKWYDLSQAGAFGSSTSITDHVGA